MGISGVVVVWFTRCCLYMLFVYKKLLVQSEVSLVLIQDFWVSYKKKLIWFWGGWYAIIISLDFTFNFIISRGNYGYIVFACRRKPSLSAGPIGRKNNLH